MKRGYVIRKVVTVRYVYEQSSIEKNKLAYF